MHNWLCRTIVVMPYVPGSHGFVCTSSSCRHSHIPTTRVCLCVWLRACISVYVCMYSWFGNRLASPYILTFYHIVARRWFRLWPSMSERRLLTSVCMCQPGVVVVFFFIIVSEKGKGHKGRQRPSELSESSVLVAAWLKDLFLSIPFSLFLLVLSIHSGSLSLTHSLTWIWCRADRFDPWLCASTHSLPAQSTTILLVSLLIVSSVRQGYSGWVE